MHFFHGIRLLLEAEISACKRNAYHTIHVMFVVCVVYVRVIWSSLLVFFTVFTTVLCPFFIFFLNDKSIPQLYKNLMFSRLSISRVSYNFCFFSTIEKWWGKILLFFYSWFSTSLHVVVFFTCWMLRIVVLSKGKQIQCVCMRVSAWKP